MELYSLCLEVCFVDFNSHVKGPVPADKKVLVCPSKKCSFWALADIATQVCIADPPVIDLFLLFDSPKYWINFVVHSYYYYL